MAAANGDHLGPHGPSVVVADLPPAELAVDHRSAPSALSDDDFRRWLCSAVEELPAWRIEGLAEVSNASLRAIQDAIETVHGVGFPVSTFDH